MPDDPARGAGQEAARAQAARAEAVRDHELARTKAKLINGETAGTELVERLQFALVQAGKPSLSSLSHTVGYSKATLSKVLNAKMSPSWPFVRAFATALKVPRSVLYQEWQPLWIAADRHRQKSDIILASKFFDRSATVSTPEAESRPIGRMCSRCGAWVIDVTRHVGWHMDLEPGASSPAMESIDHLPMQSYEYEVLREALGPDPEA